MKGIVLVILASLLLLFGCGRTGTKVAQKPSKIPAPRQGTAEWRAAQEDDIYEAVIRYEMKGAENEETYYIRTKWKDPSDEFMKRFAASKPAVKKMSAGKSLIDKSKARQIFLDDIRWKESAEVNVGLNPKNETIS